MTEPVLWARDDHTRAKHQVLKSYVDGWIAVMAFQALRMEKAVGIVPRLVIVDGFAGPGRYSGGEPGSPLILLDALLAHREFEKLKGVEFVFLFIEHDAERVAHLRSEVEALELPDNVSVFIEQGEFESTFGGMVDELNEKAKRLAPTFAFIDPFGYSSASMTLVGKLLDFERAEALFFLPLTYIHRFVSREGQENALNSLFGTDQWKEAIPLTGAKRTEFLLELFERRLLDQGGVEYVRSFQLRTKDGNDYRLVYATGHPKGLELMKSAMWNVDPLGGMIYSSQTASGQEVLFQETVDTAPLLAELRNSFGTEWFTVPQAQKVTLLQTPFLPNSHLKKLTLVPAERSGTIEVDRPDGARSGSFTDAVKIRFVS